MLYAVGVVVFALGLLLSIALHEIGHLVPAKRFGVKVTQYMVGFGPTLWSRTRGETEYGVKAIPLGGYIRMIGMVPPRADGSRSRWPRRMATAVEDFRQVSRAEVTAQDEDRQFYRLTPGKKMIIMLGGPSMNLLIYLVLTVVLLTTVGIKGPTRTIDTVSQCVVAATSSDALSGTCPASAQRAPASGVLQPGDQLEAINGHPVDSWDDAVGVIEKSVGVPLSLTIRRDGADRTVTVTPVENVKYANATGTATKRAGFLGVSPTEDYQRQSLVAVPGTIGSQIGQSFQALGNYPAKIGSLFGTVFEGKPRDPNGAIGVVGLGRIGGEVADSSRIDLLDKIYALLSLLASVNLLLFLFNLLPLLPLDGGHVAGALVEAVKRGRARLRERTMLRDGSAGRTGVRTRQQIYVDTAQMVPVMYGVASVLFLLTLLIVYADIVSPITLG